MNRGSKLLLSLGITPPTGHGVVASPSHAKKVPRQKQPIQTSQYKERDQETQAESSNCRPLTVGHLSKVNSSEPVPQTDERIKKWLLECQTSSIASSEITPLGVISNRSTQTLDVQRNDFIIDTTPDDTISPPVTSGERVRKQLFPSDDNDNVSEGEPEATVLHLMTPAETFPEDYVIHIEEQAEVLPNQNVNFSDQLISATESTNIDGNEKEVGIVNGSLEPERNTPIGDAEIAVEAVDTTPSYTVLAPVTSGESVRKQLFPLDDNDSQGEPEVTVLHIMTPAETYPEEYEVIQFEEVAEIPPNQDVNFSEQSISATENAKDGNEKEVGTEPEANTPISHVEIIVEGGFKRKRKPPAVPKSPKRKRSSEPYKTKASVAKLAYNSGKAHTSLRGKERKARSMRKGCSAKCRKSCQARITEKRRQELFDIYYGSQNKPAQWLMIGKLVHPALVKQRKVVTDSPHRKLSYKYHLSSDDGTLIPVCQTMFLDTFDISVSVVQTALTKNSPDKRGKHTEKRRRMSPQLVLSVKNHIKSFPMIESHYCRENSNRGYLQSNLSIAKMHRLYLLRAGEDGPEHVASIRQYRDIFNSCFNLGFYQPKKDQCSECAKFNALPKEQQVGEQLEKFREHQQSKETVRSLRKEAKAFSRSEANEGGRVKVICFDLQKVFFCPKSEIGEFFYKRKVACYDFTIFDCTLKKAFCYVWDMTIGGRGSTEILSCVSNYFEREVANGVKVFEIYSDSCWAQNKNQFLFTMYYALSQKFKIKIMHRYLTKGHTQMECDSVHACIERKIKNVDIYSPATWYGCIATAKVKKPAYTVIRMKTSDFVSYSDAAKHLLWKKMPLSKIHEITIDSLHPGIVTYKKNIQDPEIKLEVLIKKPGRPVSWENLKPKQAYNSPQALKPKLIKDLKWYLQQGLIPINDIKYYENLVNVNSGAVTFQPRIRQEMQDDNEDVPVERGDGDNLRESAPQRHDNASDIDEEDPDNDLLPNDGDDTPQEVMDGDNDLEKILEAQGSEIDFDQKKIQTVSILLMRIVMHIPLTARCLTELLVLNQNNS